MTLMFINVHIFFLSLFLQCFKHLQATIPSLSPSSSLSLSLSLPHRHSHTYELDHFCFVSGVSKAAFCSFLSLFESLDTYHLRQRAISTHPEWNGWSEPIVYVWDVDSCERYPKKGGEERTGSGRVRRRLTSVRRRL